LLVAVITQSNQIFLCIITEQHPCHCFKDLPKLKDFSSLESLAAKISLSG
jgi:hypothetical protein